MVHYCAAFGCKNSSFDKSLSFHSFPRDEKLKKVRNNEIKSVFWSKSILPRKRFRFDSSFFVMILLYRFGLQESKET